MLSAADEHLGTVTIPSLPPHNFVDVVVVPDPEVLVAAVRCVKHPRHFLQQVIE